MVECLFDLDLALPTLGKFWIRSAPRNDGVVLGAYLNGESAQRLVGIAVSRLKKWATIEYIFVDEEFRGQGVGTQLVQTAASLAQERGKPVIKAQISSRALRQDLCHLLEKVGLGPHTRIFRFRNKYSPASLGRVMDGKAAAASDLRKGLPHHLLRRSRC